MVAMSKEEMIGYLRDYSDLQLLISHNGDSDIWSLFTQLMRKQGRMNNLNLDYYKTMVRVYTNYNLMRVFSFTEDFLLNHSKLYFLFHHSL